MRSWGRSARGGGAAARNAPPGLAPRPPAALAASVALCLCARLCRSLARRAARPRPAAPPSRSARSLSLLRVVTKHYKKTGHTVPGIGGAGHSCRLYTRERGLRGGFDSDSLRCCCHCRDSGPHAARPQLASRPLASPRPGQPGGLQGTGRAPRRSPRDARARAPLWTLLPPTSGRSAGHRWPPRRRLALGTVGGAASRPETSVWDQVGRRSAVWRGWPLLVPGAFPGFPSLSLVFPGREGTR